MKPRLTLLAITASAFIVGCKPKLIETTPKNGPVTEAVFASGDIEPKNAYTLTSISDGFVTAVYVSEGDLVNDQQLLFRLDNRQQNTQVSIAETNVAHARMNAAENAPALLQIKSQIDAARVKMEADSVTLSRLERLYKSRTVSQQDVDNATVAYRSSYSSYRALKESYKATYERAQQELANSLSQLQNARAGNQYFDLKAAGAGKVYQIYKKQGDLVRRGDKVALLGNPDSIIIYLDIDEGSVSKIQEGQRVLVELNTDKGKTYEATLSKIYPHFNEATQSYKAEARFTVDTRGMISGTQLQANIIVTQKENALLIPRVFLRTGNTVLVKHGDALDTVTVKTGIASDEWVEILEGINAGDKIVRLK